MLRRKALVSIRIALGLGVLAIWPNVSQAASCTLLPQNPTVSLGKSISWSYSSSGFSESPDRVWTFQGGNPKSSTSSSPTASYATAGTYTTSLKLTRGSTVANCSTTVKVGATDTVRPTVSVHTPVGGPFTPPQTVAINATASDNVGVTKVDFYDGTALKGTDTTAPYSYAWSFTSAHAGAHVWTAKAYDAAGNIGTSAGLTLVVAGATPNVSINSTSQDSAGMVTGAVPQQSQVIDPGYSVLAINDLGMHCGDLDTRIAGILPPFQVLLGQVIQKGGKPTLNPAGVSLSYSAVANPIDPILSSTVFDGLKANGGTYKTNFWDTVDKGAYDPFYPGANPFTGATLTPLAGPPFNVTADTGLPVPNVEDLYLGADGIYKNGDESLTAVLHAMPGGTSPYVINAPQLAQEYYANKPFFAGFPFGYIAQNVNWFEGAGVPFAAFDDFGRENAYAMVRVQAKNAVGSVLSTVDTVLPISGEASCTNCHSDPTDVQNSRSSTPTNTLRNAGLPVATSLDDPDTTLPTRVSVEYAADINLLRLHDLKHGAAYVSPTGAVEPCTINASNKSGTASCLINKALVQNKPVVCQVCHYTPALDLAQLGPQSDAVGTLANGRNQTSHKSNSNVMHSHHGSLAGNLFPAIPAPIQDVTTGAITNQTARLAAMENSCYQCHPGKNTKCLRGAMFNGGMLCSDCHGSMAQVGDDFSKNVSPTNKGAFILAKDFYTNPATPRVPWANEPGCGSCHTGDAASNLATATGVLANKKDTFGNSDNLRLRQAYKVGDAKATPIVPVNKRFAEPVVPASFKGFTNPGAGNPQLYRVSSGHGGVMCEGCHGATHAEWPNANPNANDNVTAKQLQGHTGTLNECSTCHTTSQLSANTQGGPHGMHLVNDNRFWNEAHKNAAEAENRKADGGTCVACHGKNHEGTVLSRTPVDRTWLVEGANRTVKAGQAVACNVCHSIAKSFGND
jgi:hypothetical protein